MHSHDPYHRQQPFVYECVGCANRVEATRQPTGCPLCGGPMLDLSMPRE